MFEQDRVILRLQQRVNQEPAIRVCFLAGSYGRNANDDFSDLDVALIFADEANRELAWRERREFIQSVLPYVSTKSFDATHVRPYFHIALYSNGAKVDYRYETLQSLLPNPWDRDIRLLKDSAGWGDRFRAATAQTAMEQPRISTAELAELDDRFWVMFWDVFRLLLRGDHDKPFTIYLELLHFSLPPLLHVLPLEEPVRQNLLRASFSHDTQATAVQMAKLLRAYLAARAKVVERLHLAFVPNNPFENEIMRMVERHTIDS
jgi:hypothetical protein